VSAKLDVHRLHRRRNRLIQWLCRYAMTCQGLCTPLDSKHGGPPVVVTYGEVVDRDGIYRIKVLSLTRTASLTLTGTRDARREARVLLAVPVPLPRPAKAPVRGVGGRQISLDLTFRPGLQGHPGVNLLRAERGPGVGQKSGFYPHLRS
jgi:hypothetical protein